MLPEQKYITRFLKYIDSSSGQESCWPWMGARSEKGYGKLKCNYVNYVAHRLSYEIKFGPIPNRMLICHHCDNPPCCNPSHLFCGTVQDNSNDMKAKGRQASGDRNVARCKPWLMAWGDRHPYRINPELHARGERVNTAILTADIVREIRIKRGCGATFIALARAYGCSKTNIRFICSLKTWKHVK